MTRIKVSGMPRGTPLGRRAGLVGLGFLFAGFNTGNNLFYLVFTVLAASELSGFLLARWALRRLEEARDAARRRLSRARRVRLTNAGAGSPSARVDVRRATALRRGTDAVRPSGRVGDGHGRARARPSSRSK
jgi:hypothetical protein